MKKQARPKVWLVDDREENRRRFIEFHSAEFDVKVFESPDQLLTAIRHDRPDALLCDIFFYRDPEEREKKEARVAQKAQQIQRLAVELRSDRAADGIGLIERVRHQFRDDPPFPIYAYTSKGPYLLQDEGFDRLEKLDARWLFKGRYSPQMERHRITKDIAEFEEHKQWTRRVWNAALRAGIVGAILGVILDRFARVVGI